MPEEKKFVALDVPPGRVYKVMYNGGPIIVLDVDVAGYLGHLKGCTIAGDVTISQKPTGKKPKPEGGAD